MATFPYYDPVPKTGGREEDFSQATTAVDVVVREQVAAWKLLQDRGGAEAAAVATYKPEVVARNITTEPTTGPMIRAYVVARNLVELADRGSDWNTAVTNWLLELP